MTVNDAHKKHVITALLTDLVARSEGDDSQRRLGNALRTLVTALLGEGDADRPKALQGPLNAIWPVSAEEVGELYEFLRGFSLSTVDHVATLVPTPLGKRNQGLFYTPRSIVTHIVQGTLSALGPLTLPQLLTLKVLDPAMGTGVFLAEVLDQLTSLILATRSRNPQQFDSCVAEVGERLREEVPGLGPREHADDETVVRCHVLRNCIYGVDLDPIAVEIAGAVLVRKALSESRGGWAEQPAIPRAVVGSSAGRYREESSPSGPQAPESLGRRPVHDPLDEPECATAVDGRRRRPINGLQASFSRDRPTSVGCPLVRRLPETNRAGASGSPAPSDPARNLRVGNSLVGEGFGPASQCGTSKSEADFAHARIYLGLKADPSSFPEWAVRKRPFHWPLEFPETLNGIAPGFDAVMGNPPYEILSVRESGIDERRRDQAYFRKTLSTCQGKINTYRLMLERGLDLLKEGGALGFIVPATLLADSTAEKLRGRLLESSRVVEVTIIPEKAKVFPGVTKAFLMLITVKGFRTHSIKPVFWNGSGSIPRQGGIEITRDLFVEPGMRVPLVRTREEKALLRALMGHAPLGGSGDSPPVARVNQGEVNLTVHRQFVTDKPTEFPLVRGEHVIPFRVVHPSPRGGRLDWVDRAFFDVCTRPGTPWKTKRIVVGRVVNMDTRRRLKAAPVPEGSLLGDMTNSLTEISVPLNYLLGLLNSSLLNWRLRLTSTNNYISAAEIKALPIPKISGDQGPFTLPEELDRLVSDRELSTEQFLAAAGRILKPLDSETTASFLGLMVSRLAADIAHGELAPAQGLQNRLDAVVALLYGVESYVGVFAGRH